MLLKNVLLLVTLFFLFSCSPQDEHIKAIIKFRVDLNDFKLVKKTLLNLSSAEYFSISDNSYAYGTQESPQFRLIIELKDKNNLLIYTNCYSDWKECYTEILCYKKCNHWTEILALLQKDIVRQWEILNLYKRKES